MGEVSANLNPQPGVSHSSRWPWFLLAAILLAGMALRLINAWSNLGFAGDQGEYLLAVIRWLRGGHWPLVGQHRAVTDDFTIGPGWFYTIAPGFLLTGFHPAGGVITQTAFFLAAALLSFQWLRATTHSQLAALFFPLCMALSPVWVGNDRALWPPHILHFGVIALAVAIHGMPRHPLRALTAVIALWAILPHWHTTGIVIAAVSLPFVLWQLRVAAPILRCAPRLRLIVAALLLASWIALLYIPPMINEWSGDSPNLLRWVRNSLLPVPPSDYTFSSNLSYSLDLLSRRSLNLMFGWTAMSANTHDSTRWLVSALMAVTFVAALFFARRHRRAIDPSVGFLCALLAAFLLLMISKAEHFIGYYAQSVFQVPVLLTAWAAGIFLAAGRSGHSAPRALGGAWLALGMFALLTHLPAALAVPFDASNPFRETKAIADWIAEDAAGTPLSLTLIEPVNYSPHYHALLARAGNEPLNARIDSKSIPVTAFGDHAYVIVAGPAATAPFTPVILGLDPSQTTVQPFDRAFVMRIARSALPASASELVCGYDLNSNSFFIMPDSVDNPISDPLQY